MVTNWLIQTDQFKNGKQVEAWLDKYFRAQGFAIEQTTKKQERILCLGDRIFRKDNQPWFVEYKSGIQTYYTGNIFLETISVDKPEPDFREGWVLTCRADFVVYATIYNGVLLIFKPDDLREALPGLRQTFREVATGKKQNKGYNTHGLIVPFEYARDKLAVKVLLVSTEEKLAA